MTGSLRWVLRVAALMATVLVIVSGPGVGSASAHPLGNLSVNRYTGLLVAPDHILLDHVLDLAEVPTAQLGDAVNDLETVAARQCDASAQDLDVRVAGAAVPLAVSSSEATLGEGQAGLTVLRVECLLRGGYPQLRAETTVAVVDTAAGAQVGWREMTARTDRTTFTRSDAPDDSLSDRLSAYPENLLSTPLDQSAARLVVRPGGPAGSLVSAGDGQSATSTASGVSGLTDTVAGLLDDPGLGIALLTLGAAITLGAAHAVAPGHGKTVMAFYLVDQRRRSWRTAAVVGLTVTFSHTAAVVALGLLVAAGAEVVPSRVYPWLAVLSGALVLGLGVALLRNVVRGRTEPGHGHAHGHGHGHGHGPSDGDAGGHQVTPPSRASVLALGIAGGLVPSPSALILLLAAIAAGRPWFGAITVLAFGAGMAVTLAVAGLLAAGLTARLESFSVRSGRWVRPVRAVVSYGAAGGVCLVGAGLVLRAAVSI